MANEKEELKRKFEKEAAQIEIAAKQKKIAEMNQTIARDRAAANAKTADEQAHNRLSHDERGSPVEKWAIADSKGDAAVGASARAYDDWRAAMFSLVDVFSAVNEALSQSLMEGIYSPIGNKIVDWVIELSHGNPHVDPPNLKFFVSMDDKNCLQIGDLTRSDLENVDQSLNNTFKAGVRLWLKDNGYTPDPRNPNKYLDTQNQPLTKAIFDSQLLGGKGLENYIQENELSRLSLTSRGP